MAAPWLALKVFVSSTFKDLEQERDQLDGVFRAIGRDLIERQLTLLPYDLRWRTVDTNGTYVDACLNYLRRCRYFIGVLDSRYGTRPESGENHQPNPERLSITAMEVREAIAQDLRRIFFLREASALKPSGEVGEQPEDGLALQALKDQLTATGETVVYYRDTPHLLQLAGEHLRRLIDADYPVGQVVPAAARSAAEVRAGYMAGLASGFVGRRADVESLLAHARSGAGMRVVHAVAGTGKSALMAHVAQRLAAEGATVIAHWLGVDSGARTVDGIMTSLAAQLHAAGRLDGPLPDDPLTCAARVADVLRETDQPIVLMIDALDEVSDAGRDLRWLPGTLGSGVRTIVSSRPTDVLDRLLERAGVTSTELAPLDDASLDAIVAQYVADSAGRISLPDRDRILLRERAAGNPLFLIVALDELQAGGTAVGQLATTVEGLFQQIVARLSERHGSRRVHALLGLVAAARYGLAESELADLLTGDGAPIPRGEVALLLAELRNFIVPRDGLLTFFHAEFGRSVRQRLGVGGMREFHQRLMRWFADRPAIDPRRLSEYAWQCIEAGDWQRTLTVLSDPAFVATSCERGFVTDLAADYRHALTGATVTVPDNASAVVVVGTTRLTVGRALLELISEALHRDLTFLVRHPECALQTIAATCRWVDDPAARDYLQAPDAGWPADAPASEGPMCILADAWLRAAGPHLVSLRPPDPMPGSNLRLVLRAHGNDANGASYSPDGHRIVSAGIEGIVRVHDADTGQELARMIGHEGAVYHPAFSPDGRRVASASIDRTVRIWDAATGAPLQTLPGHNAAVDNAVFSPDGSLLVSGSHDASVIVRDAATGNELRRLSGHTRNVTRVMFSADGARIVTASEDKTVRIWQSATGEQLLQIAVGDSPVSCASFSPDGATVVTASWDAVIRVFDGNTGEQRLELRGHDRDAHTALVSGNGRRIASAAFNEIRLWDATDGKLLMSIPAVGFNVHSIAFSPDSRHIVSAHDDGTVRVWNVAEGAVHLRLDGHAAAVSALAVAADGRQFATASWDETAIIWDANGRVQHRLLGHENGVRGVAFHPSGSLIATAGWDRTVRLWDTATGNEVRVLSGHTDSVSNVVFAPDGKSLASSGFDRAVRVWNTETGECTTTIENADAMRLDRDALYRAARFGEPPTPDGGLTATTTDGATCIVGIVGAADAPTLWWPMPFAHAIALPGSNRIAAATEGGYVTVLERSGR